jgi:ABC-type glycerol-3-phosphate transport system substrate-binding protein
MGTINGVAVKPMSWGGKVEDLFDMYKLLWSQGNGGADYTAFINQQGEEPVEEYYKSQSIKNALEGMVKLLNPKDGYSLNSIKGCGEKDNIAQQQNFLNGECVFCPSGSWFATEMKDSITKDTFEFGFANMPLYNEAETTRTTLINTPTENFFIPKDALNADIAVEFLKFVFTAENCVEIHKAIGTPLAIKYDFTDADIESMDSFSQQVTNIVFNNKIVMRGSSNPMFLKNVTCGRFVDKDGNQLQAFHKIADGTYDMNDLDSLMADSYFGFKVEWNDYRKAAGLSK